MIKKILKKIKVFRIYIIEKKNIFKKRKLFKKITLNNEQKNQIKKLWKENYGKNISLKWHRLYTSYTGMCDVNYFPEILFTTNLLDKLNPKERKKYLSDKVLTLSFFNNLNFNNYKVVKNIVYNCNGYFYDDLGIISYDEVLNKIKNIGEVIIKPSIDTNSGKNVELINIKDGIDINSNKKIERILESYNKNYMIQEKIIQHKAYAVLNETSVNTVRINTYICDNQVFCSPISMRIGRKGSIVDNAHAGGIQIGVTDKGILKKYAFTEFGKKYEKHPDSNMVFENYEVPGISRMLEFVKKFHYKIPHVGIIAWDLTLDENENIVVIETNINCPTIWFPQYVNGESFFGENTKNMIKKLKEKE